MAKIYISGKITGIENEAPALFEAAEFALKDSVNIVINPIKLPHKHANTWEAYLREDIKALCDCDTIYMLKNWTQSKGAMLELELAMELGLKVIFELKEPRKRSVN